MNKSEYHSLINDTLTHIKELLPSDSDRDLKLLPIGESNSEMVKEEGLPICKGQGVQHKEPKNELLKEDNSEGSHKKHLRDDTLATTSPNPAVEAPPPLALNQETETAGKTFIELELPKNAPPYSNEEMRKILKEIAPDLYYHESIPSDHRAKRIKEAWKEKRLTPAIPILFQGTQFRNFVQRIAKAIDTVYGSCRLVDVIPQKKWDLFLQSENLKLILAPDTLIFGNKELLPFYQETPQQKKRTLGNIPLLLLPDLSLYYKDPYLKRSLWNVICNTINSLPSS